MKTLLIYSFLILFPILGGCNKDKIPGVYRIDIQQGNAISQEMINKLKPGMSKRQVAYIMGTPLLIDTFHPNQWNYIYYFHPGNGQREQRNLTLYFDKDDKLTHIEGDIRTVAREELPKIEHKEKNVVVPLQEEKTGIFQGILNRVGLGDDDSPEIGDENQAKTVEKKPEADNTTSTTPSSKDADTAIQE